MIYDLLLVVQSSAARTTKASVLLEMKETEVKETEETKETKLKETKLKEVKETEGIKEIQPFKQFKEMNCHPP